VIIGRPDQSPEKKSHPQRAPTNRASQVWPMSALLLKADIVERGLHSAFLSPAVASKGKSLSRQRKNFS
jgi:hypothetical protein